MATIINSKGEPVHLKQGSKVFSKLFSRESSAAAPSFRVYYGVASAGSVPFLWESQPGTPKNDAISADTLPPLTPPPSYYTAASKPQHATTKAAATATVATASGKKHSKHGGGFFSAILPRIILHRRSRSTSSASPTSSSCSSSSVSAFSAYSSSKASSLSFRGAESSPAACSSMRSRVYAFSVGDGGDSSEEDQAPPPMCFSVRHDSFRALKGCRVATTVRSALASVGGHGTTSTAAAPQRV